MSLWSWFQSHVYILGKFFAFQCEKIRLSFVDNGLQIDFMQYLFVHNILIPILTVDMFPKQICLMSQHTRWIFDFLKHIT